MNAQDALPIITELFNSAQAPTHIRALAYAKDLVQREAKREGKTKRQPRKFGQPWTAADDKWLQVYMEQRCSCLEIATFLERTPASVRLRLQNLGWTWTEDF